MNTFDKNFTEHPVHAQLKSLIMATSNIAVSGLDQPEKDKIHRVKQAAEVGISLLKITDPILTSQAVLDDLHSYSRQAFEEINNFVGTGNSGHLQAAINQIESFLAKLPLLFSMKNKFDLRGFNSALRSYRNSLTDELSEFQKDIDVKNKSLIETRNAIEASHEQLSEKVSDLSSEISNQKKRLDDAISEYQKQFSTSEESRRKEFEKENKKRSEDYANIISDSTARLVAYSEQADQELARVRKTNSDLNELSQNSLDEFKRKADELLQIMTEKTFIKDYSKNAQKESSRAFWWSMLTGSIFVGFMILSFSIFYNAIESPPTYVQLLSKIPVLLVLGAALKWTSTQANQHRKEERINRRTALELIATEPFICDLPVELRNDLKSKIADKILGHVHYDNVALDKVEDRGASDNTVKPLLETIKSLLEVLQKKS